MYISRLEWRQLPLFRINRLYSITVTDVDFGFVICFKPLTYIQKTGNRGIERNVSSLSYGPERNSASTVRLPIRCSLAVRVLQIEGPICLTKE